MQGARKKEIAHVLGLALSQLEQGVKQADIERGNLKASGRPIGKVGYQLRVVVTKSKPATAVKTGKGKKKKSVDRTKRLPTVSA
jgi:hypothetical protein